MEVVHLPRMECSRSHQQRRRKCSSQQEIPVLAFHRRWRHASVPKLSRGKPVPGGPFTSPCDAHGRIVNIRKEKKVWCSQEENPCRRILFEDGNAGAPDEIPCY